MSMSRREVMAAGALVAAAAVPAAAQAQGAPASPPPASPTVSANTKPKLSTHVLDTYHGRPGAGVKIDFARVEKDGSKTLIKTVTTNADGRTDQLLFTAEEMAVGTYELTFHVADYYRAQGLTLPEPAFLGAVPVRFGIFDAKQGYHVPLLCTPWTYTTYRGS
ncbi:hydroxyisourate hydrolase [Azospirillum sp.]|uniref:hydroxyisourate hydrolase n=1 Tax=Azospirillum sp. TaxID=34012 RepID=UPI003D71AA27